MVREKVNHLVIDSGAFIKNAPIYELTEKAYTVHGAVAEIRDKATKQRLQFLPYELCSKEPSKESLKYVTEFSKKTGDFPTLSAVDIQIIALTYDLEKEAVGTDHLKKEPKPAEVSSCPVSSTPLPGFYFPKKEEDLISECSDLNGENSGDEMENWDDSKEASSDSEQIFVPEKQNEPCKVNEHPGIEVPVMRVESGNDGTEIYSDEEDSWITPLNIEKAKEAMGALSLETTTAPVSVACITTDFAIQNVLIQMGLNVLTVDGMLIKHTKVFILRCYACYKTTSNMDKKFCPSCGNKCLKRVSCTVNEDGTKNIHINFKRPINVRGLRFSLPTPRGGKHSNNPIVCEDQPAPQDRPPKSALRVVNALDPDYVAGHSPFAINDIYSRAAQLGIRGKKAGNFRSRNPNANSQKFKKRK